MARIEVLEIRPVNLQGNLKAFVTIRISECTIRDCRIIQQPEQQAWVSPPQREYTKDGVRKFFPVVEFAGELKEAVSRAILTAWAARQGVENQQSRTDNYKDF